MKETSKTLIKLFIAVQFLWCQTSLAAENKFSAHEKMEILLTLPNWQSTISAISALLSSEDIAAMNSLLKMNKIDPTSKIDIVRKNGSFYLNSEKVTLTNDGVLYKGMIFKYNPDKSFEANYDIFLNQMKSHEHYSNNSFFINTAYAQDGNNEDGESASKTIGDRLRSTAFSIGMIALVGGAVLASGPAVASGALVVGVLCIISIVLGLAGLVMAGEIDSTPDPKSFKCLSNGFSVQTAKGMTLNIFEEKNGQFTIEEIQKSGKKVRKSATSAQNKTFLPQKKLCDPKNAELLTKARQKISEMKTAITSPPPPSKGSNTH